MALVTGAGSGIGRASAIAFGRVGVKVVAVDIAARDRRRDRENDHRDRRCRHIHRGGDVSSSRDVENVVEVTRSTGRLDFAHNNVGIEGDIAKTAECSEENWDRVIATNLKSTWLGLKYEIPPMVSQGRGSIVNTSSVYGLLGCERGMPAYAASKHGIIGLTRTAALEYAPSGVRVNAICPGPVNTPFRERLVTKSGEGCPGITPVSRGANCRTR